MNPLEKFIKQNIKEMEDIMRKIPDLSNIPVDDQKRINRELAIQDMEIKNEKTFDVPF